MGLERALREAGDARENLVRGLDPDVGFARLVVDSDERPDGGDELADAAMHAPPQLLGRQRGKPALDQIQATRRRSA